MNASQLVNQYTNKIAQLREQLQNIYQRCQTIQDKKAQQRQTIQDLQTKIYTLKNSKTEQPKNVRELFNEIDAQHKKLNKTQQVNIDYNIDNDQIKISVSHYIGEMIEECLNDEQINYILDELQQTSQGDENANQFKQRINHEIKALEEEINTFFENKKKIYESLCKKKNEIDRKTNEHLDPMTSQELDNIKNEIQQRLTKIQTLCSEKEGTNIKVTIERLSQKIEDGLHQLAVAKLHANDYKNDKSLHKN